MLPYRAELEQRVCVMVDDGSGLDDPPKCLFSVDLICRHLLLVLKDISLPQAEIERLLVGRMCCTLTCLLVWIVGLKYRVALVYNLTS